ncbi:MAG: hypothetical protein O2816_00780 [Planctomycetota bacterium]|nr:hypothetical protein [Planctomycetota bacterium]
MLSRTLLLTALSAAPVLAQNSSKKIRPEPSEVAARAGQSIEWRADLEAALAEAADSGKPVLWYVPTIPGSFMDRTREIDRYLLAGPFSWPRTIELVNEHFVAVRAVPNKDQVKAHGLQPMAFIEPGWLVLDGAGEELAREHQISTFHPARFLAPLAAAVEVENPALDGQPGDGPASKLWMQGARQWHAGEEDAARASWGALRDEHAAHPLAAKAAMELEGHGPFVHAFETYAALPEAALAPNPDGTQVPAGVYTPAEIRSRSVEFLLQAQRTSGGWEDSTYDFGGTDALPNVYVAISAVCGLGLLEHAAQLEEPDARVEQALERALQYVSDDASLNLDDTDEIFWAHMYRARLYVRWIELRPGDKDELGPHLAKMVQELLAVQQGSGAWAHEYPSAFVTGDALVALAEARALGFWSAGHEQQVGAGVQQILNCRTADGAITYYLVRRGREARAQVQGSVGRTPRCELALHHWSPDDTIGLEKAVALSFEHEDELIPTRKYDNHTRNYAYGGFFFFWDLQARVDAIAALPEGEQRSEAVTRQRAQLFSLPEFDGVFVDSHEIGRSYGTGMALWCLGLLDELD